MLAMTTENPHRRQHLPDGIADGAAPGGKGVLPHPGYIRIKHIDEFFMGLGELGQHPGKEAENARRQITRANISKENASLYVCLVGNEDTARFR